MDQSGHTDPIHVEKVFFECNQDVGDTICKLQDLKSVPRESATKTRFDEIREILEEKEKIFRKVIDRKKST